MIIGIDPGAQGAIAWLDDDGTLRAVEDMPTLDGRVSGHLVGSLFLQHGSLITPTCVVEDVHAMPGQGVSTTFRFGRNLGTVEGAMAALGAQMVYVSPAKWKRAIGLSKDKTASRLAAIERFPEHADLFKRVKDDGRAEAALIAEWWRARK